MLLWQTGGEILERACVLLSVAKIIDPYFRGGGEGKRRFARLVAAAIKAAADAGALEEVSRGGGGN
jgi:hypothetical protein